MLVLLGLFTFTMCNPDGTYEDSHHHHHHHHDHNNFHSRPHQPNKYNDNSKNAKILQQDFINAGNGYNFV